MKHLKEEFDKLSFKDTLMYSIAILSIVTAFVLLFCGMFTAPEGEIHDSVLTAFGIVLLFVGTLLGLDLRYASKTDVLQQMIRDFLKSQNKEEGENKINLDK
ncbi:MAG: hypothetical protein HDS07_00365 [Bacteroides sp.]|nr:hypothetical protein [Bacteroides sp.]